MIDLKLAIVWGSTLAEIKKLLDETESMYLGLFINSLKYESEEEGKKEKRKYLDSLKSQVKRINKEVATFNQIRRFALDKDAELEKLPRVDFKRMREVVLKHKGDYPSKSSKEGKKGLIDEIMGTSDSASSLARRHTALQLKNTLMPLRIGLGTFVKNLSIFERPFQEYTQNEDSFRPATTKEIEKAMASYSIGLKGEALFILGRSMENLCDELLKILKKHKTPILKTVNVSEITFDKKLNLLHYKLKCFTPSTFSKAMGLKWDRNTIAHEIRSIRNLEKNAPANIAVGISVIFYLETKIKKLRLKKTK